MREPTPRLLPDAPLAVESGQVLFRGSSIRRRGFPSLVRLPSGRLLLAFMMGTGPASANDTAVMLSHSDDDGTTWDDPFPIFANPGWQSLPMGGIAQIDGDRLRLIVGRIKSDPSLPGDEPITDWFTGRDRFDRRRPDLVRPEPRDPAVPDLDRAVRREQSAPPRRWPAALGDHRDARTGRGLAERGQRDRLRRHGVRADHADRRGARPELRRPRPRPAARRPLPRRDARDGHAAVAPGVVGRRRGDLDGGPADRLQGLEHEALPAPKRLDRVRLPRRGSGLFAASASASPTTAVGTGGSPASSTRPAPMRAIFRAASADTRMSWNSAAGGWRRCSTRTRTMPGAWTSSCCSCATCRRRRGQACGGRASAVSATAGVPRSRPFEDGVDGAAPCTASTVVRSALPLSRIQS